MSHSELLPDEGRIQRLIDWAYRDMDPQRQLDAATEMCEALKNAVDLETSRLVSNAQVEEIVCQLQPHLLFLLESVRSTTVRTYAARAFGYSCTRQKLQNINDSLTLTLLNTIRNCVLKYEDETNPEIRDKQLSLCESCLWPLTECMKNKPLRNQILQRLEADESLLQNLLFLGLRLDHTGTKTNLFALLIRMLKEDQNGGVWRLLYKHDLEDKSRELLREHESFASSEDPDWIRNLKTLHRLMVDGRKKWNNSKKISSPIENDLEIRVLENCGEMGIQVSLPQVRTALAKIPRSSNETDRLNDAVTYLFEHHDPPPVEPVLNAQDQPNMLPHPSNPACELMFVGLQSDPVCFDRVVPSSLAPAVLDFDEEEKAIQEAINSSQFNFSWCFDVLSLDNVFKVIYRCNILHISGHGEESKFLVENGFGTVKKLEAADLANMNILGRRVHHLRFVFVSMCHSGDVAKQFVQMGVPHVVAVNNTEKVKDCMAVAFAKHFYNLFLGQGQTIKEAFQGAQSFCSVNFPSTKSPLILLPEDGNHDKTLQELYEPVERMCPGMLDIHGGAPSEENLRLFKRIPSNIIPARRNTIGRHVDILKGFCFLYKQRQNRVVLYHGAPHVGKRTVVGLMAFTVHRLKMAQNGVLYVPFMKQVESLGEFVKRIFDEIQRLSLDGKALDGIGMVEPTADSVLQYLLNKNMCIFFVCEHGSDISDWLPEDDGVLHEVIDFLHWLVKKGNTKLKFVICVSKPGLDRLQSCGEYWGHLPEVQVNLMDLIQAKDLVRKTIISLVGNDPKDNLAHKINTSGIFKREFGLPLSPRIIEKLVLLCCRKNVDIGFLTKVLRIPNMRKLLKVANKQYPQAVEDLQKWKASVEELQSYVENGYYSSTRAEAPQRKVG